MNHLRWLSITGLLLSLVACSDDEPVHLKKVQNAGPAATIPTDKPKPATATPAPAQAAPAPAAPAASADRALTAATPQPAQPGELVMTPQAGWVVEKPSSAMRKAHFRLPRQGSDEADGDVIVFFFPGQGGSVEANIDRWANEWSVPSGDPKSALKRETRTINGLVVHHVDLTGEWSGGMNASAGKRANYRLLAAIVETPNGPWFLKLVGPQATLGHWEPSWRAFIDSFRLQP